MRLLIVTVAALAAAGVLLAGCSPALAQSQASVAEAGYSVVDLPLPWGYYVDAEVPCARASNATIVMFDGRSLSVSRARCEFLSLVPGEGDTMLFEEECQHQAILDHPPPEPERHAGRLTILGAARMRIERDQAWGETSQEVRLCPLSSLPWPWRDIDPSDLIR